MIRSTNLLLKQAYKNPYILNYAKRYYVNAATVKDVMIVSVDSIKETDELGKDVEKHYDNNHIPLAVSKVRPYGEPYTDVKAVEAIHPFRHIKPKYLTDKFAWGLMNVLRVLVHIIFRDRYLHHACILETVAAVPGMVAGMFRHFRSLRRMTRDHGWIGKLIEEAENERMHLLTWMQLVKPNIAERFLVILAQVLFVPFYSFMYLISPATAHRMVGYLEEEAVLQYTHFLNAIDNKEIENVPAPEIAIKYWNLPPNATLRDVVVVVRADEMMHRDFNHKLGTYQKQGLSLADL